MNLVRLYDYTLNLHRKDKKFISITYYAVKHDYTMSSSKTIQSNTLETFLYLIMRREIFVRYMDHDILINWGETDVED